ncbi:MAG TPA: glycosyltransferase family 39 protein [Nitrososphaera sp.]|jgi:dolichyl-phosphate-mannose-protein mannosyltransferase|nr:glycosyltransferase family 39 protein [Nitrososphaera sp.]
MLQVAVSKGREPVIIFLAVMAIGLIVAFYLYLVVDKYSLLYYWDAVSHLVASRKFVDWGENPGLNQIGTVWMPLPHFLLLPFTLVNSLFTTGFAGTALSLPCLALTAVYLFKIAKALKIPSIAVIPSYAAFAGAMLYAANPSILYLGITSMTEAPFMLFFVASAYYFQSWYQNGNRLKDLILCSVFLSFATLCRYESWFLPIFLIIVVAAVTMRGKNNNNNKQKAFAILAAILSLSSITFWLEWNQYHYGNAFEFSSAQYYSASWYAQNRAFRELLFLQPANVLSVYGYTAFTMFGPFLLGAGAIGYYVFRKSHVSGKKLLLLFLALPPIFTIVSLLIGIGEMAYWFNSRFMVLLSPLVIVMACIFLANTRIRAKNRMVIPVAIGLLFASQLVMPAFSTVITMNDAIGGYSVKENQLAVKAGEALKSLYDNGNIMVLTGSGLEQRIMITSGIALKNFDEIIEGSTWKASFKEPWAYDRWIVITSRPGTDALTTTQHWLDRQDELDQHYKVAYENEFYKIMVLR